MLFLEVTSNGRSLVFFNPLVKMSARIADIPCITKVTLKIVHNALLIHKGWLVFPYFDFIKVFPHFDFIKDEIKVRENKPLLLHYYFYSHLKMTSERSKRRDFLSLSFITKEKKILHKICARLYEPKILKYGSFEKTNTYDQEL